MLRILAVAPADGWAFVETAAGSVFLVRPPYHLPSTQVSAATPRIAVSQHGFEARDIHCEHWDAVVAAVNKIVNDRRKPAWQPPGQLGGDLLAAAPDTVFERFLDQVEKELIDRAEFLTAETVLMELMSNSQLCADPRRMRRVSSLFRTVLERRRAHALQLERFLRDHRAVEEQFPLASARYGSEPLVELSREISETKQILKVS